MKLKEYIKFVVIVFLPIIIVASIGALIIVTYIHPDIYQFISSIIYALVLTFGIIKYTEFIFNKHFLDM